MGIKLLNTGLWLSEPRLVAGIMTGTSVDGIDVAFGEFRDESGNHRYSLKAFGTFMFHSDTSEIIKELINGKVTGKNISALNFLLAEEYKSAILKLCHQSGTAFEDIDAVGIHGQTLWHFPNPVQLSGFNVESTYQAGSVSALAALTGKTVVGDFRAADIALGGQGAPLVPVFDYHFLKSNEKDRVILNIGGIANITVLRKGCNSNDVIAFDTGPGNYLIDLYTQKFYGLPYDKGGAIAASGNTDARLLGMMKALRFISAKPPKSTGRDFLPEHIERYIERYYCDIKAGIELKHDLIRTLTELTAWSIAENIRQFAYGTEEIIASGGGVHNYFLMDCLSKELRKLDIRKSDDYGIPADAKEAVCFAYLAYRTLGGLPGNLPSVTGASRESVLGVMAF